MIQNFDPKDPSTSVSVLRYVHFKRVIEKLGGGTLTECTVSVTRVNDCEVDLDKEDTPLEAEIVAFTSDGFVITRITGGTFRTTRFIRYSFKIVTPYGEHTDNFSVRIDVRHT